MSDVAPRVRRHRLSFIALLVALGILTALALGALTLAWSLQTRLDRNIERIPALVLHPEDSAAAVVGTKPVHPDDSWAGTGSGAAPVNFLLLGTDSRISAGDPTQWNIGAQRTDAIILAQLAADREAMTIMSIPRDSWVEIPGHGTHKINAAYSFGGPHLTVRTVELLTGAPIDHVAITDFDSFSALTDQLGGVDITLSQPLTLDEVTLEPGTHRLDGEQALHYARERYNVAGGDFGRVQRHQNWMRSIMARAFEVDLLTDPRRLVGFLDVVSQSVAVDEGFKIGEMRDLALDARHLRPPDVRFITAPHHGTGWSPDGRQSIVVLDDDAMHQVSDAFAEGTIADLLETDPEIAPRLGGEVGEARGPR